MDIKKDDYIAGTEHYGLKTRQVKGWVDSVMTMPMGKVFFIQADDEYQGHRGSAIREELGEITILEPKDRIEIQTQRRS